MALSALLRILVLVASLVCVVGSASADSWGPPKVKTIESPDGKFRFTVTPGDVGWTDARARKPVGRLENRSPGGGWRTVWERPLVNSVAPLNWLVADSGRYVVTFDNWLMAGVGPDVVVVYDAAGKTVVSLALDEILPRDMVPTLPRSVSSIWWAGEHVFSADGSRVLLRVARPGDYRPPGQQVHFTMELDPLTGRAAPVLDSSWWAARASVARFQREKDRLHAARTNPVVAPELDSRSGWRVYLRDAYLLLDRDGQAKRPEITLLRMPPDADAVTDLRWIRSNLRSAPKDAVLMFASPASGVLARELTNAALHLPANALLGRRIYVVAEAADVGSLRLAMGRTGAELVLVQPDVPIPQRPEQLRRWQERRLLLSR
jgi:hypothetical protein